MDEIKYSTIIDLYKNENKDACVAHLMKYNQSSNAKSIKHSVNKIVNDYKSINKSKSREGWKEKIESFMETKYSFPEQYPYQPRKQSDEYLYGSSLESAKRVSFSLASDLQSSLKEKKNLEIENEQLKQELGGRKYRPAEIKKLYAAKKQLEKNVAHLNNVLNFKNITLKRIRASNSHLISKNGQWKTFTENLQHEKDVLQVSLNELQEDNKGLMEENQYLRDLVNDNQVNLYDDEGKFYTSETQECVYTLLNQNVTTSKVAPVIEAVLKLVNMKANKLPSVKTVNNMNIQRLILAQKQLSETLPEKKNLCLLSDETSKYGKKIEGYHVSDQEGKLYVLGLRQIATKSGQDTLSTFQDVLSDINQVSVNSENPVCKQILLNIVSTMSDKAATQQKFNTLLEDYRKVIIQEELGQAWLDMSLAEQTSISRLNRFFCGLHALVHMAETASSCLDTVEKGIFDEPPIHDPTFRRSGESATARLVRTVSKAFSCGGDEKCGVYGPFNIFVKDFLKDKNMRSIPIERYHGNRFNILFSNAASIYFMKDKVKEYLEGDDSNRLLKSVKHDINVPEYIAGVKALGLVSYLISSPLWCFIEDKRVHIMDSPAYYNELITYITDSVPNAQDFIEGKRLLSFCDGQKLLSDEIYRKLIEPWEHDDKVIVILNTVLPGIAETMKKLFLDFLDGGQWQTVSEAKRQCTRSVPKNNKFSETVFGYVDRILREKPNISVIAQEAYIMFCHNKTLQWLEGKTEKEKVKLLAEARKDVKSVRLLFQRRRGEIEARRQQLLREKFAAAEEKERKRIQRLEGFTNSILDWGLWQTVDDVDNNLSLYKSKRDKIAALKAQLNFRKNVLHQSPKDENLSNVYAVSKKVGRKRVDLSVEELSDNVKSLVRHAFTIPTRENDDGPVLVGRDIRMKFDSDTGFSWFIGHVISKVPGYCKWYNVKFENDRAIYTYELLDDYRRGDVQILV